jgi:spore coat polysaccharide biosynthesis protein SpsF (cytidylyltransferase family)
VKKKQFIIAAIQARMGSTRLPGKVMKELHGKPMIWHIYKRLKAATLLNDVVVSTSNSKKDGVVADFCGEHDIKCYRGAEADLVDRLYGTARRFGATALLRVTGDCPFVDPLLVDRLLEGFVRGNYDYASNWSLNHKTLPHGLELEVYSTDCLARLWNEVKDPHLREWIPFNIHNNLESFRTVTITSSKMYPDMRLTVDYEEDFELTERIYDELGDDGRIFGLQDIADLFEKHPDLAGINAMYSGKTGAEDFFKKEAS